MCMMDMSSSTPSHNTHIMQITLHIQKLRQPPASRITYRPTHRASRCRRYRMLR